MSILKKTDVGLKYRIRLELSNGTNIESFVRKVDLYGSEQLGLNLARRIWVTKGYCTEQKGADPSVLFGMMSADRIILYLLRNKDVDDWFSDSFARMNTLKDVVVATGYMNNPDMTYQRLCLNDMKVDSLQDDLIAVSVWGWQYI